VAGDASHDPDDNCRHTALHCSRVGNRNFFRVHTALSAKNIVIDRDRLDLPLQQDCSCDCSNAARPRDLGDARDLSCGISIGVLELASVASPARAFPPVWAARLCTLACIFARRLAHILACARWFAVSRGAFGDHHLFCNAVTGKPGPNATEAGVSKGGTRCLQRVGIRCGFAA
jgi:hypothetical protein